MEPSLLSHAFVPVSYFMIHTIKILNLIHTIHTGCKLQGRRFAIHVIWIVRLQVSHKHSCWKKRVRRRFGEISPNNPTTLIFHYHNIASEKQWWFNMANNPLLKRAFRNWQPCGQYISRGFETMLRGFSPRPAKRPTVEDAVFKYICNNRAIHIHINGGSNNLTIWYERHSVWQCSFLRNGRKYLVISKLITFFALPSIIPSVGEIPNCIGCQYWNKAQFFFVHRL